MYVPTQPVFTAILDFVFLGDTFYLSTLLCGGGVIGGLACLINGRRLFLREEQAR